MAQLIPVSTWGLTVAPNVGPEEAFSIGEEPGTLQLTMAAIDPGEDVSQNEGIEEYKKPRATVKMIVLREPIDDDDDDEDDEDLDNIDMDDLIGENESDNEDGNGEGPSDPNKSPKEMKKAALKKALKEDQNDVLANAAKGKGKATENGDMDLDDSEDSEDEDDVPPGAETYVLCTLDPENHFNQPLNITIPLRETVAFRVEGTHSIHLTGNIVYSPADEPPYDSEGSDAEEDEDEEVDLTPDEDELDVPNESESDELDDIDDPRVTELGSDEDEQQAPKLVKASSDVKKGKNKRPADDSPLEEKETKPTVDSILGKALKKEEVNGKQPEVNGEKPMSKTQLKKMRKKMKDNAGNAVEVKQDVKGEDEGERVTIEAKKESPGAKTKQVQFAEKLVQGPGVNGAGNPSDKSSKTGEAKKDDKNSKAADAKGGRSAKEREPRVVDGVTIDDRSIGKGAQVKKGDQISCRYIGKLENRKEFDANRKGTPFKFKVGTGAVIKGMDTGIQGMSVGGERRITIPSHLGYGKKAMEKIPANSNLIFDIKLLGIN